MNPLDIASAREIIIAYGQSSSNWAASTINTWLGVIMAVLFLLSVTPILRNEKKEMGEKIKQVSILAIIMIIIAAVVMMFINNRYGGASGRVQDIVN